jgi:hypothetical protein
MSSKSKRLMDMVGTLKVIAALALFPLIVLSGPTMVSSQTIFEYRVGAFGDHDSLGNLGVQAQIQTHAYNLWVSTASASFDEFFLVTTRTNGDVIWLGYRLETGSHCLKGFQTSQNFTCTGETELIRDLDARWFWEYFLAKGDEYLQVGPAQSAGLNGTWHTYTLMATPKDTWTFLLDGKAIANLDFKTSISSNRVLVVAEQQTTGVPEMLGPVEFRNMSYLTTNGWHATTSLYAYVHCEEDTPNTTCPSPNPYGISVVALNDIITGSGLPQYDTGDVLWPQGNQVTTASNYSNVAVNSSSAGQVTATSNSSSPFSSIVMLAVVVGVIVVSLTVLTRRRKRLFDSQPVASRS